MLYGNIEGIKKSILWQLSKLEGQYSKDLYIEQELLELLCTLTSEINREICVNIDARGMLLSVGIGSVDAVNIGKHTTKRSDRNNSGVRSIHTHPSGDFHLSDMDISALKSARLDSIASIGVKKGCFQGMEIALYNKGAANERYIYKNYESIDHSKLLQQNFNLIVSKKDTLYDTELPDLRAILVYVGEDKPQEIKRSLDELESLANTLQIIKVGQLIQRIKPNKSYLLGEGKVGELIREIQLKRASLIIFDCELNAIQHKNLTEALGNKTVIDRSMLILDIFSKHAVSEEGKLQVRLAKQKYHLPLLIDVNADYDRQKGGIRALSGSGETKLESDRRVLKKEIRELTQKLEELQRKKQSRRENRKLTGIKTVCIVGYTNAGKSTLMNYIAKSDVLVENKLFATLDVTTRRIWSPLGEYLLSDTVGFISRLPHEFIQAFRSTLEETKYADLLLVVLDTTSPNMLLEYEVVKKVLAELEADLVPCILVYNKCDVDNSFESVNDVIPSCKISALTGEGVDMLRKLIENQLFGEI